MTNLPAAAAPPERILMGPGPSNVPPSVLSAMAQPTIGHLDPWFIERMNEVQAMLREVMQTENALTIPISADRCAANRSRQRAAVTRPTPTSAAIAWFGLPSAASRIIRARCANRTAVRRPRT